MAAVAKEAKRHHLAVLTNSEIKTFRRCQRLHHNRYRLLYEAATPKAQALRFGSLFHVGLEVWWGNNGEARLVLAIDAMRKIATIDPEMGVDEYELARAEELLLGYHVRWQSEPLQVLAVEKEWRAPLVNPATGAASKTWELGGAFDAVAVEPTEGCLVAEHKTASGDAGDPLYWARLRLDSQISIYYSAAKANGYDAQGVLYDVVAKTDLRPGTVPITDDEGRRVVLDALGERVWTKDGKKPRETGSTADGYILQTRPETPEEFRSRLHEHIAENPERYYQRRIVRRLEEDERDAAADVWQLATAMREAERLQRYPKNPDACVMYGRVCEFLPACSREASLDDPTFYRRRERKHTELSEPHHEVSKEETEAA